jgi:hypothetical protein
MKAGDFVTVGKPAWTPGIMRGDKKFESMFGTYHVDRQLDDTEGDPHKMPKWAGWGVTLVDDGKELFLSVVPTAAKGMRYAEEHYFAKIEHGGAFRPVTSFDASGVANLNAKAEDIALQMYATGEALRSHAGRVTGPVHLHIRPAPHEATDRFEDRTYGVDAVRVACLPYTSGRKKFWTMTPAEVTCAPCRRAIDAHIAEGSLVVRVTNGPRPLAFVTDVPVSRKVVPLNVRGRRPLVSIA